MSSGCIFSDAYSSKTIQVMKVDHCGFLYVFKINISLSTIFEIKVKNKSCFSP